MHEATRAVFHHYKFMEVSKVEVQIFKKVLKKFNENFASAATFHYLLQIALTKFFLSTDGGAWRFLNFRHYKPMAISTDKVKVHCL